MDMNTSSCIEGVNMEMCKVALDSVMNKFRHLLPILYFKENFLVNGPMLM